jgi:hypothetical protein
MVQYSTVDDYTRSTDGRDRCGDELDADELVADCPFGFT